ncbi:MAG: hypothetical protein HCA25_02560 [Dolichospermum sp. DET50]|nr:hypothetical protein [Dolichospermum sp. DET66]MBS3031189.1 hypothetical protein [Dolichospermum sp. DET67]MBS3036399.1 hypothetical protein [Dolichospermum sp. DET50]QSX68457.1 MAG: hypothetical protein EZY12_01730 [Dolichospermum sp. DET69]
MAMTAEKALQNNQSILQNFGLVEELDEQAAEIISGGQTERFTIRNKTRYDITYILDGKRSTLHPGDAVKWRTGRGGIIRFDSDALRPGEQKKEYDLSNGGIYEFQDDRTTPYQYDLDLYWVRR